MLIDDDNEAATLIDISVCYLLTDNCDPRKKLSLDTRDAAGKLCPDMGNWKAGLNSGEKCCTKVRACVRSFPTESSCLTQLSNGK